MATLKFRFAIRYDGRLLGYENAPDAAAALAKTIKRNPNHLPELFTVQDRASGEAGSGSGARLAAAAMAERLNRAAGAKPGKDRTSMQTLDLLIFNARTEAARRAARQQSAIQAATAAALLSLALVSALAAVRLTRPVECRIEAFAAGSVFLAGSGDTIGDAWQGAVLPVDLDAVRVICEAVQ